MNFSGLGTDVMEVVEARINVRIVSKEGRYRDASLS